MTREAFSRGRDSDRDRDKYHDWRLPEVRHRRSPVERRRSRSPFERRRSKSRSPLDRSREKRRSPSDRRDRDYDSKRRHSPSTSLSKSEKKEKRRKHKKIDLESCQDVDDEMSKIMGFGTFDTTKNKKVADNVDGAVKINKPRKYRQYMNRKGGFNRPLDYVA